MSLNRYPHKLYKVEVTEEQEDEFGQPMPSEEKIVFVCDCYEQVLGESKEFKDANGSSFHCSSKIFLPIVTDILTGERIEIRESDNETIRLQGEVKRNSNTDIKHSRLWV